MEKSFEWWIENIMDDRLEYLDSHEKYKLYKEWLEKNNKTDI